MPTDAPPPRVSSLDDPIGTSFSRAKSSWRPPFASARGLENTRAIGTSDLIDVAALRYLPSPSPGRSLLRRVLPFSSLMLIVGTTGLQRMMDRNDLDGRHGNSSIRDRQAAAPDDRRNRGCGPARRLQDLSARHASSAKTGTNSSGTPPALTAGMSDHDPRLEDAEATVYSLHLLARDPEIIPGIYEACDQWCIYCQASRHCLAFRATNAAAVGGV